MTKGYTDIPVTSKGEDVLGVEVYVDSLSIFILECDTPMTIAIQGDWGSGKTSIMNLIKEKIEDKVITIWFNTWQFSQFEMQSYLTISLFTEFLSGLGAGKDSSLVNSLLTFGKRFIVGVAEHYTGQSNAQWLENALGSNNISDFGKEIKEFKDKIKSTVSQKLQENGKERVVIFIDDLDRLSPDKAVEILEVLKVFIDVPNCIFILAVDYNVIVQGLEKKFGKNVSEIKGKSFFDKIIQLPFAVPLPQYNIDNYIKDLLEKMNVKSFDEDLSTYKDLIELSIGFNPRSVKRLFNSFLLLNIVAAKKNLFDNKDNITENHKKRVLFAVLCLQMAFEPVYEYLLKHLDDAVEELENLKEEENFFDEKKFYEIKEKLNFAPNEKLSSRETVTINKISNFMNTFFDALQIDDNKNELSKEELENFISIIKLSSITSTYQDSVNSFQNENVYIQRKHNKELVESLVKYLNKEFKDKLKGLQPRGKKDFRFFQSTGTSNTYVRIDLALEIEENVFEIRFVFDNDCYVIIYYSDEPNLSWFKEKFGNIFPNIDTKESRRKNNSLERVPFLSNYTDEEKIEIYKDKVVSLSNKILENAINIKSQYISNF